LGAIEPKIAMDGTGDVHRRIQNIKEGERRPHWGSPGVTRAVRSHLREMRVAFGDFISSSYSLTALTKGMSISRPGRVRSNRTRSPRGVGPDFADRTAALALTDFRDAAV
jgi:hypothetical protein